VQSAGSGYSRLITSLAGVFEKSTLASRKNPSGAFPIIFFLFFFFFILKEKEKRKRGKYNKFFHCAFFLLF
jgi:uncharacterized membrane protein